MSQSKTVRLAVVGAHLRGQPLNSQLTTLNAHFSLACKTQASYRLFALAGTVPPKPGLEFVKEGGVAIDVEVWELGLEQFGAFTAAVPPPLAIGTLFLESGEAVKGFVCEPFALKGATDISQYGGWKNYLVSPAWRTQSSISTP